MGKMTLAHLWQKAGAGIEPAIQKAIVWQRTAARSAVRSVSDEVLRRVLKNNVFATVLAARTRVRGMVWKKFAGLGRAWRRGEQPAAGLASD